MSNTFWAVFFGASAGLFSVNIITTAIEEWRHREHQKNLELLWQELEDYEFEDDDYPLETTKDPLALGKYLR